MHFGLSSRKNYEALCLQQETFVHLFYSSEIEVMGYELSLQDLIHRVCEWNRSGICAFVTQRQRAFILLASPLSKPTTNSVEDGVAILQDTIDNGGLQTSFVCHALKEGSPKREEDTTLSTLVVLANFDNRLVDRFGILPDQLDAISAARRQARESFPGERTQYAPLVVIVVLIVFVFGIITIIASQKPNEPHSWTQYETSGSIGPQYQLSIDASNASLWASSAGDPSLWTLRIDDQAIIPSHLLDDDERHYQEWIQNRYSEMNQIRLNGSYINETWLSSDAVDLVPMDEHFHFAHCVLAVKRYIKAKDTGRHVCGRDIDREHMQHCLDALDWVAFPEGKMGDDVPNRNRTLWWRTKVCFD